MLQPPQAVFPPCICAAVLPIVHLMEDGGVREDGVAGERQRRIFRQTIFTHCPFRPSHYYFFSLFCVSTVCAVAQQVLWNCLIEDPALVLRHFLEKLTVSNRQVSPLKQSFFQRIKDERLLLYDETWLLFSG